MCKQDLQEIFEVHTEFMREYMRQRIYFSAMVIVLFIVLIFMDALSSPLFFGVSFCVLVYFWSMVCGSTQRKNAAKNKFLKLSEDYHKNVRIHRHTNEENRVAD